MLAAAIDATQTSEVERMAGWLRAWGEPATAPDGEHAHADHGGMPVTGPEQIAALRKAHGVDFDRTLLNLLIGHQHSAVEMARREVNGGVNVEAVELARQIDKSRTAQIALMLAWQPEHALRCGHRRPLHLRAVPAREPNEPTAASVPPHGAQHRLPTVEES